MAYEKALRGDDWDFMEDSDDEGDVDKDGFNEDEDEMRHLDHYIAFLRVVRGAAALKKAGGDLRGAEDLCRFAGRAPAPSLMLMNLPNDGSVQVSEARATSVELAAADGEGAEELRDGHASANLARGRRAAGARPAARARRITIGFGYSQ